jgi:hypothetical protein
VSSVLRVPTGHQCYRSCQHRLAVTVRRARRRVWVCGSRRPDEPHQLRRPTAERGRRLPNLGAHAVANASPAHSIAVARPGVRHDRSQRGARSRRDQRRGRRLWVAGQHGAGRVLQAVQQPGLGQLCWYHHHHYRHICILQLRRSGVGQLWDLGHHDREQCVHLLLRARVDRPVGKQREQAARRYICSMC